MMFRRSNVSPDGWLIVPKLFYFCYFGAAASLIPFLIIYYDHLGLSGRQIGLLAGIPPLMMLAGAPLWGGAADAMQRHAALLKIAIAGTLVIVLVLSGTHTFGWLIPVIVGYAFFAAPIMPLVDNTVMTMLGPRKDQYGKQRLWGALGWGTAAPVIGFLIERSGLQWVFWGYLILMFGGLVVSWQLPVSQDGTSSSFWAGLRLLLTKRAWLLFLAMVFMGGMGLALISNFLFLYLDRLEASKTLMGLSLTFGTFSELPVMFFADRLLKRWGAQGLLIFALTALVIRIFAYSLMSAPWVVLPIQLLHGSTFSALWVAGVSYADEMAPPGLGATAQGVFTGVFMGLSSACGSLIGGVLYDSLGGAVMFRWAAVGVLVGLGCFILLEKRALRLKPRPVES